MAERFNLTAQLQLQAPTNTRQIADQIRKQLAPVGAVDVQLKADSRALRGASDQLNQLNKATKSTNKSVGELNRTIAESARRFSVITVATGTLLGFVNSLKNSTKAAIEFEREIVKIQQVTGKSATQLKALTSEVTRLSTSLGASSADLLNVSRILLQTGLSADKTRKALDILAKTSLGATFDSIQDTTEGAIALLRQFGGQARKTGKEIQFLEQSLDAINSVSKSFAVESGDLVTAIRRVGGVFAAAGGEVNELIALFTSVRATTRESAETIATGLRTIFTRIQRGDTVNQLKELGIELQDAQGNFVGAFEAFKRLSQGLSALDPKSFRFSEIVEQLGGFRQVGKVIPLIQQFTTAQQALAVAQASTGSVAKDAQTAQQSLAVQIQKTREQFDALIRKFADSTTFRSVANFSLELAQSLIKVTEALEPLLPLLTSLLALKVGKGLGTGLGALASFGRGGGGAPVSRFARGGMVPGSGNTDSVPAMLTPGEFVIRKSSVKKLGASTLQQMNQNRFEDGGFQKRLGQKKGVQVGKNFGLATGAILRNAGDKDGNNTLDIAGAFLQPQGVVKSVNASISSKGLIDAAKKGLGGGARGGQADISQEQAREIAAIASTIKIGITSGSLSDVVSSDFRKGIENSLTTYSKNFAVETFKGTPSFNQQRFRTGFKKANLSQIEGGIFEAFVNGLSRTPFNEDKIKANDTFDFPAGLGSSANLFGVNAAEPTDAKRTFNQEAVSSLTKKGLNRLYDSTRRTLAGKLTGGGTTQAKAREKVLQKNAGGGISGSDTVPALLTPGEFVINKKAASRIGGANLNRMNKQGVQGFAKGGPVGFQNGGSVAGKLQNVSFGALGLTALASQFDLLSDSTRDLIAQTSGYVAGTTGAVAAVSGLRESFFSSIEAKKRETQASNEVTESKREEAAASREAAASDDAKSGKGRGGALFDATSARSGKIIGGAIAIGTVLQTVESQFAQAAESAQKELDAFSEAAKKGGEISVQGVKDSIKKSSDARQVAELAAAGKTIATYTALGTSIAGPFGGAVGFVAGLYQSQGAILELVNGAQEKQLQAIEQSTLAYLKTVSVYAQAEDKLNEVLNLPTASEDNKGAARRDFVKSITDQAGSIELVKTNARLNAAVVASGESLESLANYTDNQLKAAFQDTGIALDAFRKDLESSSVTTEKLQKAVTVAGEELQRQLADLQIGTTFDEAIAAGGDFALSLTLYKDALKAQQVQAIANARAAKKSGKEINELQARFDKLNDEVDQNIKAQIDARNNAAALAEAENKARIALIETLKKQEAALQQSISIRKQAERELSQAKASRSIRGGGSGNFGELVGSVDLDPAQSGKDLKTNLDNFISTLSGANKKLAEEAAEGILFLRGKFEEAGTKLLELSGLDKEQLQQRFGGKDLSGIPAEQLAQSLGLDLGDITQRFGPEAADAIRNALKAAFADGQITASEIQSIKSVLGVFKEGAESLTKTLVNLSEAERAKFLKGIENLDKEDEARKRNIESLKKFTEVASKIDDVIAEISGSNTAGFKIAQSRADAQRLLNANTAGRGGVRLQAGDVRGLAREKRLAIAQIKRIEAEREAAAAVGLTPEAALEFEERLRQLNQVVNDVNNELDRLGDRSLQVSKIQEDFARQQKRNQQAFEVVSDFVVGDRQARNDLNSAARGILLAVNTGTLQNQTGEQRAATVGLLDRLSDVFIGNTGLTGKDIKRELIFQDAIKLGLPPEIAEELAFSTSLEQQTVDELRKQTQVLQNIQLVRTQGFATGGSVGGSSIFQPKGTDTVPAMLTPGEFVIKRSAVNSIGADNLAALNNGQGVVYRQGGGIIPKNGFTNLFTKAAFTAKSGNIRRAVDDFGLAANVPADFRRAKRNDQLLPYLNNSGYFGAAGDFEDYLNLVRILKAQGLVTRISANGVQFNPQGIADQDIQKKLRNFLAISQGLSLDGKQQKFVARLVKEQSGLDIYQNKAYLEAQVRNFLDQKPIESGQDFAANPANQQQRVQPQRRRRTSNRKRRPNPRSLRDDALDALINQPGLNQINPNEPYYERLLKEQELRDREKQKAEEFENETGSGPSSVRDEYFSSEKIQERKAKRRERTEKEARERTARIENQRLKRDQIDELSSIDPRTVKQAVSTAGSALGKFTDYIGVTTISPEAKLKQKRLANQKRLDELNKKIAERGEYESYEGRRSRQLLAQREADSNKPDRAQEILDEYNRKKAEEQAQRDKNFEERRRIYNEEKAAEEEIAASDAKMGRIRKPDGTYEPQLRSNQPINISKENMFRMQQAETYGGDFIAGQPASPEKEARKRVLGRDRRSDFQKRIDEYGSFIRAYQPTIGDTTGEGFVGSLVQDAGDGAQASINTADALQIPTPFGTFNIGSSPVNIPQGTSDKALREIAADRGVLLENAALEVFGAGANKLSKGVGLAADVVQPGFDSARVGGKAAAKTLAELGGNAFDKSKKAVAGAIREANRAPLSAPLPDPSAGPSLFKRVAKFGSDTFNRAAAAGDDIVKRSREANIARGAEKAQADSKRFTPKTTEAQRTQIAKGGNKSVTIGNNTYSSFDIDQIIRKADNVGPESLTEGQRQALKKWNELYGKGRFTKQAEEARKANAAGSTQGDTPKSTGKKPRSEIKTRVAVSRKDKAQADALGKQLESQYGPQKLDLSEVQTAVDPNTRNIPQQSLSEAAEQPLKPLDQLAREQSRTGYQRDLVIDTVYNPNSSIGPGREAQIRKWLSEGRVPDALDSEVSVTLGANKQRELNVQKTIAQSKSAEKATTNAPAASRITVGEPPKGPLPEGIVSGPAPASGTRNPDEELFELIYGRERAGYASGGSVAGGNDRVPAMLTPGEFVMSPEAVNKYGVGYMKSLNRGRVPGFRRGGIVGRGNVQYRANGSSNAESAGGGAVFSFDTSGIQSVLETFNTDFAATLNSVVNEFSSLTSAMTKLSNTFSGDLSMKHTFSGDMTMAFNIGNLAELQQAIARAMTPTIVEQIKQTLAEMNKSLKI